MKKILAIILAAVLVLSFAACKKNDTNNDTTAGDAQTSGQAADVSASDDTASSEEASSEVETEVVTDRVTPLSRLRLLSPPIQRTRPRAARLPPRVSTPTTQQLASKLIRRLSPRQSSSRAADRTWLSRAASLLTAASALCSR